MRALEDVEQAERDGEFSAVVTAVTAAFGDQTRRQIYLAVKEEGRGVTAAEIARRFALHPNVARHHLDKLAAGGYLEVSIDHSSAGAGRPSKRYRRSHQAASLPVPARSDALLLRLLARALELLDPNEAEQMAMELGEDYGRVLAGQMAPGMTQRSVRTALGAVADALTAHGFAARAETREETTAIVRDNCPFGALATTYPILCALDRGMVQGLLEGLCGGAVPVKLSSRALGAASCASVAG
jgi:predicted ArsR family transcriptional regulator